MEKDFKELIQLLKLGSGNDLFIFENGKVKRYEDRLEFQYHLSNLHELALSGISNIALPSKKLPMIDAYNRFIVHLDQNKEAIIIKS